MKLLYPALFICILCLFIPNAALPEQSISYSKLKGVNSAALKKVLEHSRLKFKTGLSVVFLRLGDRYWDMGKRHDAVRYYEKYLSAADIGCESTSERIQRRIDDVDLGFCSCSGIYLALDEAPVTVKRNRLAMRLLKSQCLWVMDSFSMDLRGAGKKDLVLVTAGEGCGSCHATSVYVIFGNKTIVLEEYGFNNAIGRRRLKSGRMALVVLSGIIKDDEPSCCPSMSMEKTVVWSKRYKKLRVVSSKRVRNIN